MLRILSITPHDMDEEKGMYFRCEQCEYEFICVTDEPNECCKKIKPVCEKCKQELCKTRERDLKNPASDS